MNICQRRGQNVRRRLNALKRERGEEVLIGHPKTDRIQTLDTEKELFATFRALPDSLSLNPMSNPRSVANPNMEKLSVEKTISQSPEPEIVVSAKSRRVAVGSKRK